MALNLNNKYIMLIYYRFSIRKIDSKGIFSVDSGVKLYVQGMEIIDEMFLKDLEVPIPFCSSEFKLPGR